MSALPVSLSCCSLSEYCVRRRHRLPPSDIPRRCRTPHPSMPSCHSVFGCHPGGRSRLGTVHSRGRREWCASRSSQLPLQAPISPCGGRVPPTLRRRETCPARTIHKDMTANPPPSRLLGPRLQLRHPPRRRSRHPKEPRAVRLPLPLSRTSQRRH
jgi:hypothetical protein